MMNVINISNTYINRLIIKTSLGRFRRKTKGKGVIAEEGQPRALRRYNKNT
jgi:hypothetical protein